MRVTIRKKKGNNGSVSLYLDIYNNGKRKSEFLEIPRLGTDAKHNKEIMTLANRIRAQRELELASGNYNFTADHKKNASLLNYFEKFAEETDKNSVEYNALNHFKKFPQHNITFRQIDVKFLEAYKKHLLSVVSHNTAASYFNILQRVIKKAVREDIIGIDPTLKVKNIPQRETKIDFLLEDEIQKLMGTKCTAGTCQKNYNSKRIDAGEMPEIKRAFLFACFTGLRYSDLKNLQYKSIKGNRLEIIQKKVQEPLYIPLTETAKELLPQPTGNILPHSEAIVFSVPSKAFYNKILKQWFKDAGIEKKASSHIARHSFACLLLSKGVDLYTVSKYLGHRDIKTTQRYAKVINAMLEDAASKLPKMKVTI